MLKGEGYTPSQKERLANFGYDEFKACLLHSREHPISIEQLPQRIETGLAGATLNEYNKETIKDPQHMERGGLGFLDKNGELIFPNSPLVGTKKPKFTVISNRAYIEYSVNLTENLKKRPNNTDLVLLLHTHPFYDVASPEDLSSLIFSYNDYNRAMALMTATRNLNILFLRTAETHTLPAAMREGWINTASEDLFDLCEQADSGFRSWWYSNNKRLAFDSVVNSRWTGKICTKHKIATYTSRPNETEYIRAALV